MVCRAKDIFTIVVPLVVVAIVVAAEGLNVKVVEERKKAKGGGVRSQRNAAVAKNSGGQKRVLTFRLSCLSDDLFKPSSVVLTTFCRNSTTL